MKIKTNYYKDIPYHHENETGDVWKQGRLVLIPSIYLMREYTFWCGQVRENSFSIDFSWLFWSYSITIYYK